MRTRFALICAAVAPLAAFAVAPTAGAAGLAAPDPGGDPNAAVALPPPAGKYMGFNDDAAHSVHGLTPPEYVERAQGAGANLIRASLDWRDAEPMLPDLWNEDAWARWQELYDEALDRDVTPMFTIGFAPIWARELDFQQCGGCRYPPAPWMDGEWAEFAAEVARRFPLAVIEVWNEPNLRNFWAPGADPQRYAELLAIAHDAIKQVSPSTTVLGGALANVQRTGGGHMALGEFLDAAYSAAPSIAGNLDALSFHPYPEGVGLGANTLFAKSFADVRTVKATHDPGTPLFVSEVGASTGAPDSLSESEQAATLQALYRRAMTMGDVLGVVFHRLIEPADTSQNEWELGVAWLRYDPDRDPPPSPPREVYCRFAAGAGHSYPGCPDPPPPPSPAPPPIPGPPLQGPQASAPDASPQTGLRRLRKRRADRRRPRFKLFASEPASFECAIDRRRFKPCRSRYRTPRLRRGRHRLQVRAVDLAGQLDPTPAKRRFKVRRRRP